MSTFLQVDSRHLHVACGRPVCCSVCPGRLSCHGLGRGVAHCLGIPHHLVCQLSLSLLGLPDLQHRYTSAHVRLHTVQTSKLLSLQRVLGACRIFKSAVTCIQQHSTSVAWHGMAKMTLCIKLSLLAGDLSRNNWWVAALAFGEGWHNNHHAFEFSARHGLDKWQIDITWLVISALQKVGLATNVKLPTERQKARLAFE